jgi:hypothetical protein
MRLSRTAIQVYPRPGGTTRTSRASGAAGTRVAVSLHSHSECSREKLDFIPGLARRIPLVAALFERGLAEYKREHGRPLDFATVYWRPPLAPGAVIESEREQIERRLDSAALVSLTDHDTFEGPRTLRAAGKSDVPLSVEWSVPFEATVFHLGVHGVSPRRLDETERGLAAYTAAAVGAQGTAGAADALGELLDSLCECPETFVVLNHPYWDVARVGQLRHDSALLAFLRRHRDRIHGLELNGYRDWAENRRVLPLAEGFGFPVVGGGDRHGYSPNTIVNLTNATCLAEFAHELRAGRVTHCVMFPEYAKPYVGRVLQGAGEQLKPHHQGRRCTWAQRVFVTTGGKSAGQAPPVEPDQSVDSLWESAPWWLNAAVAVTRMLGSSPFAPLFELTRADGHETLEVDCRPEAAFDRVPRLVTPDSAAVV